MPFLDFYSEKAPGQEFCLGSDPDTKQDVMVYVRSVPGNVIEDIERKHRKRKTVKGGAPVYEIPQNKKLLVAFEQAAYAWTECKGFTAVPRDKEGAALFSKELGRKISIGETVVLDGKLTDRIKIAIFNMNTKIFERITEMANLVDEENIDEEAGHTENLLTGSNGESTIPTSQTSGVADAEF